MKINCDQCEKEFVLEGDYLKSKDLGDGVK